MTTQRIREIGFHVGANDAASAVSNTPCPYPAGSWQAIEWESGYEAGAEYFLFANPQA